MLRDLDDGVNMENVNIKVDINVNHGYSLIDQHLMTTKIKSTFNNHSDREL